jgi:phosphoribosyl-dephospho-CoA transferase
VSRPPSVENGAIGLLGIVAAVVAYQNAWITVTGSVVKAIKTNDLTGAALDAAVDAIVTTQEGSSRHLRNSVSINFPSARGVDSYLIMLFTTGTPATS